MLSDKSAKSAPPLAMIEKRSRFSLGAAELDLPLHGGLERAALHEIVAEPGHMAAAAGFCAAITQCALKLGEPIVWAGEEMANLEGGSLYGPGLAGLGLEPAQAAIIRLRTSTDLLRAGIDAARCPAVGAVILETMDAGQKIDLTATRRLALAAEKSGVTVFLIRAAGHAPPGAAQTRWLVRSNPSRMIRADSHGLPRFDITLLKHRAGIAGLRWHVEWNSDRRVFQEALSQPVASLPVSGRMAA